MTQEELDKMKQDLKDQKSQIETDVKRFNFGFVVGVIMVIILILFLVFGCKPKQEDYNFVVVKSVQVDSTQVVTFANKITYYTLWLPLEPKYEVGDTINPNR